jgi:hypothetical protein
MTPKQQILKYSKITAGLIRLARNSRNPVDLLKTIEKRIDNLLDMAHQSIKILDNDKYIAKRCAVALEAMVKYH